MEAAGGSGKASRRHDEINGGPEDPGPKRSKGDLATLVAMAKNGEPEDRLSALKELTTRAAELGSVTRSLLMAWLARETHALAAPALKSGSGLSGIALTAEHQAIFRLVSALVAAQQLGDADAARMLPSLLALAVASPDMDDANTKFFMEQWNVLLALLTRSSLQPWAEKLGALLVMERGLHPTSLTMTINYCRSLVAFILRNEADAVGLPEDVVAISVLPEEEKEAKAGVLLKRIEPLVLLLRDGYNTAVLGIKGSVEDRELLQQQVKSIFCALGWETEDIVVLDQDGRVEALVQQMQQQKLLGAAELAVARKSAIDLAGGVLERKSEAYKAHKAHQRALSDESVKLAGEVAALSKKLEKTGNGFLELATSVDALRGAGNMAHMAVAVVGVLQEAVLPSFEEAKKHHLLMELCVSQLRLFTTTATPLVDGLALLVHPDANADRALMLAAGVLQAGAILGTSAKYLMLPYAEQLEGVVLLLALILKRFGKCVQEMAPLVQPLVYAGGGTALIRDLVCMVDKDADINPATASSLGLLKSLKTSVGSLRGILLNTVQALEETQAQGGQLTPPQQGVLDDFGGVVRGVDSEELIKAVLSAGPHAMAHVANAGLDTFYRGAERVRTVNFHLGAAQIGDNLPNFFIALCGLRDGVMDEAVARGVANVMGHTSMAVAHMFTSDDKSDWRLQEVVMEMVIPEYTILETILQRSHLVPDATMHKLDECNGSVQQISRVMGDHHRCHAQLARMARLQGQEVDPAIQNGIEQVMRRRALATMSGVGAGGSADSDAAAEGGIDLVQLAKTAPTSDGATARIVEICKAAVSGSNSAAIATVSKLSRNNPVGPVFVSGRQWAGTSRGAMYEPRVQAAHSEHMDVRRRVAEAAAKKAAKVAAEAAAE